MPNVQCWGSRTGTGWELLCYRSCSNNKCISVHCQTEISVARTRVNTAARARTGSAVTPARARRRTAAATVKPVNVMICTSESDVGDRDVFGTFGLSARCFMKTMMFCR